MIVDAFEFTVPGRPFGKADKKQAYGKQKRYKTDAQEAYENEVITAWRRAGSPRLPAGGVRLVMVAHLERPVDHWRRDGTLTPKGERNPEPLVKPDFDNLQKQIDVLVAAGAMPDDKCVVRSLFIKVWAERRGGAMLRIHLSTTTPPTTEGGPHGL